MQAEKTLEIVRARFPDLTGNFAVVGDLNDYPDQGTSLGPLLRALTNVVEFLPQGERWTHHWASGPTAEQYNHLDYVLLPRNLVDAAAKTPRLVILRAGLPLRATRYAGDRFEEVGVERPESLGPLPGVGRAPHLEAERRCHPGAGVTASASIGLALRRIGSYPGQSFNGAVQGYWFEMFAFSH